MCLLLLQFFLLPMNKLIKGRDTMAVPALEELLKFLLVKWLCRSITIKCLLWLLGIKRVLLIPRCLMVKTIKGRRWSQMVLPQKLLN
jgi:hypothetical protein